jgi:hypothetical protein
MSALPQTLIEALIIHAVSLVSARPHLLPRVPSKGQRRTVIPNVKNAPQGIQKMFRTSKLNDPTFRGTHVIAHRWCGTPKEVKHAFNDAHGNRSRAFYGYYVAGGPRKCG